MLASEWRKNGYFISRDGCGRCGGRSHCDSRQYGAGGNAVVYGTYGRNLLVYLDPAPAQGEEETGGMLQTLEIGDVVLTTSGFYGVLIDIKDDMVIVEFGNNKNCRIPMEKGAISRVEKADES